MAEVDRILVRVVGGIVEIVVELVDQEARNQIVVEDSPLVQHTEAAEDIVETVVVGKVVLEAWILDLDTVHMAAERLAWVAEFEGTHSSWFHVKMV